MTPTEQDKELRAKLIALKTHDNSEHVITEFGASPRFNALVEFILAYRKKHELQAYSDGFQKASKGAFKSQQVAKREAVEEVLDRLESQVRRADDCTEDTFVVKAIRIEAERNKLNNSDGDVKRDAL